MQILDLPLDTVLNLFGLIVSVGSLLIAEGLTRRKIFIVLACSVFISLGTSVWFQHQSAQEKMRRDELIANVEGELKIALAGNRWTEERISREMRQPNYEIFSIALARAIANGNVGHEPTSCRVNDGTELDTRVYYNINNKRTNTLMHPG